MAARAARAASVLWLLLGGCWTSREAGAALQRDLTALRTEVDQLGRRLEVQRVAAGEHDAAVARELATMRAAVDAQGALTRQNAADADAQRERLERDLAELRGAVELAERGGGADAALPGKAPPPAADPAPPPPPPLPRSPKEALAAADALLTREPAEGRSMLRAIVRRWPKDLGVADEALMRLGESLQQEKSYEPALQAFIKVVDQFSGSPRATEAYFQIATCAQALGRLEDAQTFFNEVVSNRPRSDFTARARARLAEVGRQLAQGRGGRAGKAKKK